VEPVLKPQASCYTRALKESTTFGLHVTPSTGERRHRAGNFLEGSLQRNMRLEFQTAEATVDAERAK
jgi:hypothetical protein